LKYAYIVLAAVDLVYCSFRGLSLGLLKLFLQQVGCAGICYELLQPTAKSTAAPPLSLDALNMLCDVKPPLA
jgi:hypothetical protein